MTPVKRRALLLRSLAAVAAVTPSPAQLPSGGLPETHGREHEIKLPSGKSQKDEILKADHQRNIEEARALAKLTAEISEDIAKSDRFILPVATLKKLDEAEKMVKKIRSRLRRN